MSMDKFQQFEILEQVVHRPRFTTGLQMVNIFNICVLSRINNFKTFADMFRLY
jgi:hypothetical protein